MKVNVMIRNWVVLFAAVMFLFLSSNPAFADDAEKTDKSPVDMFILDCVKRIRVKNVQPLPKAIKEFDDKYTEYCRKRADAEYKKHGHWFYCEDNKEHRDDIRWDESVTYRVHKQLLNRYGSLEKLPNYSKENHQKAKEFWQKWQKEDGSFYNPLVQEDNGNNSNCNGKYVSIIMNILGAERLHTSTDGGAAKSTAAGAAKSTADVAATEDTKRFFSDMARGRMNHGTMLASRMLGQIDSGKTEYIPVLERGLELGLSRISKYTGMFQGKDAQPLDRAWRDYTTTSESMKGLLRMVGYMGTENMPYRHKRADTLLAKQDWMRKGEISVKRNTAEMMVQCMLESPYRNEELLKALEGHSKVILEGDPSRSHVTGDYAAYIIKMFGPYLHWEGYEESIPRTRFSQGVRSGWRVVIGPFGRCANLIKKRPEELFTHKDWTYEKYGLRSRNTAHENRKVIDVVAASAEGWAKSTDEEGRIALTREFDLNNATLENPYLKIKWAGGDIEILLNGVLVKKKLGGLEDFGAVYIPDDARKTLKAGTNTLVVRSAEKADGLSVNAGLIDWK